MPTANILLVDDDEEIRASLRRSLALEGYKIAQAADGSEALRLAREAPPDLVVLDVMLPEVDGLEVCRRLRRDTSTASVPIIMLTAKSDEVDRVVGLEVGADDYVGKPFSPKELVASRPP